MVEDTLGIECVSWPYWIQRCERNVRALFDDSVEGYGALWSTNFHFGDFVFHDSAALIELITGRFRASRHGYANFYEKDSLGRQKPEHPIISKIMSGKKSSQQLLPKGWKEKERWLPELIIACL